VDANHLGGALFPHLYAPLNTSAAISVTGLPDGQVRIVICSAFC
jgi:uncharacterized protein (DUF952 family)